jgi:hypothetical protein
MIHKVRYPISNHRPAVMYENTRTEIKTPVIAPKGDSNNDKPKLASVKLNFSLIVGIAATQLPNSRLDTANKNATSKRGFNFINDLKC